MIDKLLERSKLPSKHDDFINKVSIKNYYWPQQKLLENNDVNIPWKRLRRKLPSQTTSKALAYTRKQIQKMLKYADIEESVIILLAASSGIRAGAFELQWKHIIPVYLYEEKYLWEEQDVTENIAKDGKLVCALIRVYEDEPEEYFALATPEFWYTVQEAKTKWIQDIGREPKPEDPVLKQKSPMLKPLPTIRT